MRTRRKKWTTAELTDNPLILRGDVLPDFGDSRALYVELGCGKGRFITEMARLNPGIRFIGVEREPKILAFASRLAAESFIKDEEAAGSTEAVQETLHQVNSYAVNVPLFLVAEASGLAEIFTPGSIKRLYINFCDPWPNKKKWAKRRLTHGNFLKVYEQLRIPEIFFKTDNRLLFEFSIESFSERGWKLRNVSIDLHDSDFGKNGNVMTEYEKKFSSLGMPIYRLEAYAPQNGFV